MDSVENVRKNKKKLIIYSVVLLIVGLFLGFSTFYIFSDKPVEEKIKPLSVPTSNNEDDDNSEEIAESLLKGYTAYYENLLVDSEEKISYSDKEAYYVENSFFELHDLFTSNITLDDLYNYYDYGENKLTNEDPNKPVYLKLNDSYYFDGKCESTGNKVMYSDFKILNRTNDTIELSYRITIMTIVDDTIMETNEDDIMVLKLENGSWKINKAKIVGRCGLPYAIG